jgi:hypothetical protein
MCTQTAVGARRLIRWYFPVVTGLLLVGMVIGFSRTFFLRSLFDVRPLPGYLYMHGAVMTAWFVVAFVQTCLVAGRRTDLHRSLGVVGAVVAVLVVPISAFVVVGVVPRMVLRGTPFPQIRELVTFDLVALLVFSILVPAAILFRRRSDVHKRLLILSCFALWGPVNARLARLGLDVPYPALTLTVLFPLLTIAGYDFIVARRLHRATQWGALLLLLAWGGLYGLALATGWVDPLIKALR